MGRIEISAQGEVQDSRRKGGWRSLLIGLLVSAVSLAVVVYLADWRELLAALRLADYRLAALGVLISLGWLFVRALAWRAMLQDRAGYTDVFFTITEGYLVNNLLPFRLGEVARALLLSAKAGLPFWQVFPTIVIERAFDLALAAGLLLGSLPFVVGADWARPAALGVGAAVLGLLAGLYLLARNRPWALQTYHRLAGRWTWLLRFTGRAVETFLDGLAVLTDGARFTRAAGWIVFGWLVGVAQYWVMLAAFFPGAKPLWAVFCLGVAAMGVAAPSSPGALGVFELAVVGALTVLKQNPSTALALAATMHVINYLLNGLLGSYGLARDGQSLLSVYQRLRSRGQEA
ncbi:MAG: flippase-like domain-containing protein [Chloroflexi bacterium]|nr:flippase-like domain-containing protein [Chloroflexota bacterium]